MPLSLLLALGTSIAIPLAIPQARRLGCWLLLFLPFVWLYLAGGEYYLFSEAPDNALSSGRMRSAIWVTPLLLLIGALLVEALTNRESQVPLKSLPRASVQPATRATLLVIAGVVTAANLYYFFQNFSALTTLASSAGNRLTIMSTRAEVAEHSGGYGPAVLRGALGPLVSLYFFLDFIDSKRSSKDLWRLLPVLAEILARVVTLHRSPAVFLLGMLLLAGRRRIAFSLRTGLSLLGVMLMIFVFISAYTAFIDGRDFAYGMEQVWDRIVVAPNFGLWNYFEVFPSFAEHTNGGNINLINKLFMDGRVIPANLYIPGVVYGLPTASWNAVFIADLWADFGWFGLLIGPFVIGMFIRFLDVLYCSYPHDRLSQAAWFASMFGMISALSAGFPGALLSTGGVGVILILFLALPHSRLQVSEQPSQSSFSPINADEPNEKQTD